MMNRTGRASIQTRQESGGEGAQIGGANIGHDLSVGGRDAKAKRGGAWVAQQGVCETGVNGGGADHLFVSSMDGR
jgi:hypothetical protein